MKSIRKIGSIIAGTAVLGAALSAPVTAGMDNTGVTKGFFYDASFNPIVQIVVGEKGMATDAVAAGNIAATVGNLAYMTKTVTGGGGTYVPEGQVVITTAARGAVGDYVQDTEAGSQDIEDFYDPDVGFTFGTAGDKTYEKGDFSSYTLTCDKQTKTDAGLLMDGSYKNIHCLFCRTLCIESLENPAHDMKEQIMVNSSIITYYEEGLGDDDSEALKMAIGKGAVSYKVSTGYIPMTTIDQDADEADDEIDFEYRGKMILFGEEYYVKDVDGDKMYLAKAKVIDDVTSEGFAAEYNGYKFKIDHLIYAEEFKVAGINIDVQKPDGTIVQTQISKRANGVVDDLEIAGIYAEEAAALQTASIIVYDLTSQVILEDNEDLEMGGKTYTDWEVDFAYVDDCAVDDEATDGTDNDCDISEYDDMLTDDDQLLKSVTITYNKALDDDEAIEVDESLNFPNKFRLTFKGYLDNDYAAVPCVGAGEGNIMLEKGDDTYQMVISLTGDDDNRYNSVRLDEGPFKKNDLFMADGKIWSYDSYESDKGESGDTDDTYDVTLDPQIRGTKMDIEDMERYCDPEDEGGDSYTGQDCVDIGDITLTTYALTDALNDDDATELENDEEITLDSYDLFIKADAFTVGATNFDVIFNEDDKTIFFAEDFPTDDILQVNGDLVGTFNDFMVDGYSMDMTVVNEAGTDLNADGDTDDVLVEFETDDGNVIVDMYDRDYDENTDTDFSTSVQLEGAGIELDEDTDTLLIVPEGGDKFTLDWGSDNRLDAVEVCHPQDDVDSTYFIGTTEEETVANSTITKADEGKEITAGCCTFTVASFDVTVSGDAATPVSTQVANKIVGAMVVPETSADTTKNLVIVGGPAVNAMTTVTADEISAAADKFIVKKDGNKLIVAGWEADDTVAAGNALVAWLNANVHA